jgi:hypothetical protein
MPEQGFGTQALLRIQRPQNELPAMAKRHPHSGTITPQSGPDRGSLLMGTVSTAAAPTLCYLPVWLVSDQRP